MAVTHLDDAPATDIAIGHLHARWSDPGRAAGSVGVGLRRIQVRDGSWSTPAHEHDEEIFYVLAGSGVSWQGGVTTEIGPGDCLVYLERRGAHTLHGLDGLDVLAFGPRGRSEGIAFPRLGSSLVGGRWAQTEPGTQEGVPIQFLRESELGPPELPPTASDRRPTVVNVDAVRPDRLERPRVVRTRRNLGRAIGSVRTGIQHVEVQAGKESTALHCHSVEEELFVVLGGSGTLILAEGDGTTEEAHAVRPGSVVARPPATGVSHLFRAGEDGLTYLAYGTRDPSDVCYYPRSNKIAFRGVHLIARLERLDYWDGED